MELKHGISVTLISAFTILFAVTNSAVLAQPLESPGESTSPCQDIEIGEANIDVNIEETSQETGITVEGEYCANTAGYTVEEQINKKDNNNLEATMKVSSPPEDSMVAQVIETVEFSETKEIEPGSVENVEYNVELDEEIIESGEKNVNVQQCSQSNLGETEVEVITSETTDSMTEVQVDGFHCANTGGYSVEYVTIDETGDGLEAEILIHEPGQNEIVSQALDKVEFSTSETFESQYNPEDVEFDVNIEKPVETLESDEEDSADRNSGNEQKTDNEDSLPETGPLESDTEDSTLSDTETNQETNDDEVTGNSNPDSNEDSVTSFEREDNDQSFERDIGAIETNDQGENSDRNTGSIGSEVANLFSSIF